MTDGNGVYLKRDEVEREYKVTKRAYEIVHSDEQLKILSDKEIGSISEEILKFMK
jgi:hypothetical protein